MDDFLHNLRSGKLKQGDRSNRPYNDPQYKGGPRRNMMDRRKSHQDNKESSERLNAIKEVLGTLAQTQKRMADAYQARTRAEERKAKAMEVLAKSLYQIANPNADDADDLFVVEAMPPVPKHEPTPVVEVEDVGPVGDNIEAMADEPTLSDNEDGSDESDEPETDSEAENSPRSTGRLTELDRHTLYTVIGQMREKGNNWEKIARHISTQGYPTVSGKGNWRGIMVKNLYEKMTSP